MTAAMKGKLFSVKDYLARELESPIKNEYVGGVVYAMGGARNSHNMIASNNLAFTHVLLHGKRCRPRNSNTKIRIELPNQTRFYHPDVSVVCEPNPPGNLYQNKPAVIFEVLSTKTRGIDEGEKKNAYMTIPTLNVYALVEQESANVVLHRRTPTGFVREVDHGIETVALERSRHRIVPRGDSRRRRAHAGNNR